ncbi:MAG: hypothetical protein Q9170_001926 [Blastenia crenularia]
MKSAESPETKPKSAAFYVSCEEFKKNGHVSYLMNSLGATLMHEYTLGKEIVDHVMGTTAEGYGPVNVYQKLKKKWALTNADSYAYYASVRKAGSIHCSHVFHTLTLPFQGYILDESLHKYRPVCEAETGD